MTKGNLKNNNKTKFLNEVIKSTGFRKLWIAQIISQLADKFFIVLCIYLISKYFANSSQIEWGNQGQLITALATGIYIANSIPAILFGAFAGIASDRWPKVKVMIISNFLRSIFSALIPLCLINRSTYVGVDSGYLCLLIITFLISLFTQFFTPAEQSSIPLLIRREGLLAANSIYQATTMGATIFGFALGEPLLNAMGFTLEKAGISGGEFFLLPICYLLASVVLFNIPIKEVINKKVPKNIGLELMDGINILKSNSIIRNAIFQLVTLYSLMAVLYVLTVDLASSIPQLGATRFGILLGSSGFGIAISAVGVAQTGPSVSKKKLSSIGFSLIILCLLFLCQFKGFLTSTLITCFTLGFGAALVAIPAQTTVQEKTPDKELGKVLGLQNNLINLALSFPLVIAGGLVSQFGSVPVLWLLAALTLFGAIFNHS